MQFRKLGKSDLETSILGFGCMRLPLSEDAEKAKSFFERSIAVDEQESLEMIDYAVKHGINYFDTAYLYHGGKSEKILGKAIKGRRDGLIITTKSPVMMIEKSDDFNRILNEQLEKLGTDYLDFYLLHGLNHRTW